MFSKWNPFKKTLDSILAGFQKTINDLKAHADAKAQEAATKEAKAKQLMAEVEAAEAEAEGALNAADKIAQMVSAAPL